MKKFIFALCAVCVVASSIGCNSSNCGQRRSWFNWWNRGDSCQTCTSDVVAEPGYLGTPIISNTPASPRGSAVELLPGPTGIPVN